MAAHLKKYQVIKVIVATLGWTDHSDGTEFIGRHYRVDGAFSVHPEHLFICDHTTDTGVRCCMAGEYEVVKTPARLALEALRGRLDNRI